MFHNLNTTRIQGILSKSEAGGQARIFMRDQLITNNFKCCCHKINPLYQIGPFARGIEQQNGRPSLLGSRFLFTVFTPYRLLAANLRLNHDRQIPTAEGAGRRSLLAQRGHRRSQSREGALEHHASQGCLRFRQRPSYHDSGEFLLLLR